MYLPDKWFTLAKRVFLWVPSSYALQLEETEKMLINYIVNVKVSVQVSQTDFTGG